MFAEPHCRAQLGAETVAGDYEDLVLPTLAGPWSGFEWRLDPHEPPVLVAVPDEHRARLPELLTGLMFVGVAGSDGARVSLRPPDVDLWDDDNGLFASIGGDGPYNVWATSEGGVVTCIVAGDLNELEEQILRGVDPAAAALRVLIAYPREDNESNHARTAKQAIEVMSQSRPSERGIEELKRLAVQPGPLGLDATTMLARFADDPYPYFDSLLDGLDAGQLVYVWKIVDVLAHTKDPALGNLALARIASGSAPWQQPKLGILRALLEGKHPRAVPELRALTDTGSPWRRANAAVLLLQLDPADCAAAAVLVDHLARFDTHDFSDDEHGPGYGKDWDDVLAAMAAHPCPTHARAWAAAIERAKTLDSPPLSRFRYMVGGS